MLLAKNKSEFLKFIFIIFAVYLMIFDRMKNDTVLLLMAVFYYFEFIYSWLFWVF